MGLDLWTHMGGDLTFGLGGDFWMGRGLDFVPGSRLDIWILVANDLKQDCLIGVDFLAQHKTVPDRHEMVVPAMCKGAELWGSGLTGIIEPNPEFTERHYLFIARVLTQPRDVVPVRLINPSADTVVLYKNTTLCTMTVLAECATMLDGKNPTAVMAVRKSKKTKHDLTALFNLQESKLSSEERTKLFVCLVNSTTCTLGLQTTLGGQTTCTTRSQQAVQNQSSRDHNDCHTTNGQKWKRTWTP
ncbi:hypothetical protein QZH41_004358 [Actinostola sp. cb2023]|nr:hypothetical protein QZH41_004358 [Actinostola sp. cb2023]